MWPCMLPFSCSSLIFQLILLWAWALGQAIKPSRFAPADVSINACLVCCCMGLKDKSNTQMLLLHMNASVMWQMGKPSIAHCCCHVLFCAVARWGGGLTGSYIPPRLTMGSVHCRRMFETAVAVGVYHKSDNSININPDEKTVFQPGDQIVVLSNTGDPPSSGYACDACLPTTEITSVTRKHHGPILYSPV